MIRLTGICIALGLAAVTTASAEEFSLTFKTIPAKDVMSFPGGAGSFGQMRLAKPAALKREPKAVSQRPLYGVCREGTRAGSLLFRLDESRGDGKGYDELRLDMNQNGDLTDDPVVKAVALPSESRLPASALQRVLFGPIEAPADKLIGGGRPVYFAQVLVNNLSALRRSSLGSEQLLNLYAGQLRLKAGWYLETTVAIQGQSLKVGLYDGDSNLRLGEEPTPVTYGSGGDKSWSFPSADSLLVDADGSGQFEDDAFDSESCPFGPLLYLGASPFKVGLDADCKVLRLEPWSQPAAEVALQPHGEQVRTLALAWEQSPGEWKLMRPGLNGGKLIVPAGNYRLYSCSLMGKAGPLDQVMATASQRILQPPVTFAAGSANTLKCGAPLEIKVTADKRKAATYAVSALALRDVAADSEYILRIGAAVRGAGGEVYSSYAKGDKFRGTPPRPTFTIRDAQGKQLANGNLEFG
ncbi:MAG TPA: hypothetical protein VNZ22_01270 [Bacillota bacterium]|nr:hypothetical protein [Bacillota bacterium]